MRFAGSSGFFGFFAVRAALFGIVSLAAAACTTSTASTPAPAPSDTSATPPDDTSATDPPPPAAPADICSTTPAASNCSLASSWVRGIVTFDPTHFKPGATPVLRVVMRHQFTIVKGEETIGGRLHAFVSVTPKDMASGQIPFSIDMCMFGEEMWSEENGDFNLIFILDENGNNDLDNATSNDDAIVLGTPDKGELVKMVPVSVSCHADPACVHTALDCVDGVSCTTITPLTTCAKKTPSCKSIQSYCK